MAEADDHDLDHLAAQLALVGTRDSDDEREAEALERRLRTVRERQQKRVRDYDTVAEQLRHVEERERAFHARTAARIQELLAENARLREQLAGAQRRADAPPRPSQKSVAELETALEAATRALAAVDAEIARLEAELEAKQAEKKTWQRRTLGFDAPAMEARKRVDALNEDIRRLSAGPIADERAKRPALQGRQTAARNTLARVREWDQQYGGGVNV